MSKSVSIPDQRKLADILDDTNEFGSGNSSSIRLFLTMAGLDKFKNSLQLTGVPRTDAFLVVQTLESHKKLEDAPDYDALGMMLEYLLSLPEIAVNNKTFIAKTVVDHGLIRKSNTIDDLCEKYKLTKPPSIGDDAPGLSPIDGKDLLIPTHIKLQGGQFKQLLEIIVPSFSKDDFESFMLLELGKNLEAISTADSLNKIVFDVIQNSQQRGWTGDFIKALLRDRPENVELQAFIKELN